MDRLEVERDFTHPFQTYPQFLRYLTGAQKKIVDALLMHGGARGNAFPSNARLSLITGMGRQTIQNLKGELCRLGVLTKKPNHRSGYTYTVVTTWRREEFLAEIYGRKEGATPSPQSELHALKLALISAEPEEALKLVERIKELTLQIQGKEQEPPAPLKPAQSQPAKSKSPKPIEAVEPKPAEPENGLVDYIVSCHAQKKPINDKHAYRAKIKRLLTAGSFEGVEEYQEGYDQKQTEAAIAAYIKQGGAKVEIDGYQHSFDGIVKYNSEKGRYLALFGGHDVVVTPETVLAAKERSNGS
ncbi:MAG: helix-turn-helix domain-containing protein [Campylobacterales bacterium]